MVSLWNDLATSVGQELLDIADKSPIVAIKSLKVGEFQGKTWDARTWLPGQRTRVRRGGTQRRGRDATDRASVPRRATWRFPNRADAVEIGADAAQIGPTQFVSAVLACIGRNGRVRPKFKKKRVQNAQFDLT